MRVGIGYDVHRLVEGRKLILGGITIPYEKGLLGHSDADVLIHAICDALLGAAGAGDIGRHFPDTEAEFKGISSIELLESTHEMIQAKNFSVINLDATLVAQAPKLQPYLESMTRNLARVLGIARQKVNVKATTTEGLGFIGKGEGIAAMCVALID
ncbi:MAG: 2-C-methyl-D-erythritol 2,4-cyclodiphosphate synthase [Desulfobacterales bacterium]